MTTTGRLLRIKTIREEKAERAMRARQRALAQAQSERDDAQRQLDDYVAQADAQERRAFQALCERPVRLRDIDDVHQQVRALRARETDHRDVLAAAEDRRAREERQLDTDRQAHRLALRARDKFTELDQRFRHDALADAERAEEAQIEEAAELRRPAALETETVR